MPVLSNASAFVAPTISVTSSAQNSCYNAISISGNVSDGNINDIITIKYNIDGGTTRTMAGTVTSDGTNKSFPTTAVSMTSFSDGVNFSIILRQLVADVMNLQ